MKKKAGWAAPVRAVPGALGSMWLVAVLRDAESHDAAHFERLRLQWEQRPYPKLPKPKPSKT